MKPNPCKWCGAEAEEHATYPGIYICPNLECFHNTSQDLAAWQKNNPIGGEIKFKVVDRVNVKLQGVIRKGYVESPGKENTSIVFTDGGSFMGTIAPNYEITLDRLPRKSIRRELKRLDDENRGKLIAIQIAVLRGKIKTMRRKEIYKNLLQLSAEAFCVDKVLAEQIDRMADMVGEMVEKI